MQRSSPYGGGLHGVSAAPASSALAASVVAGAGPSLVDSIDQRLKNDFSSGGGSFYNGAGYPGPNPTWQYRRPFMSGVWAPVRPRTA